MNGIIKHKECAVWSAETLYKLFLAGTPDKITSHLTLISSKIPYMNNPSQTPPSTENPVPIAMVCGQAFTTLPKDLYIPPDAMEVFLEAFEGPLDLLLYLIKKQNVDILNIPIAEVTRQYIEYVDLIKTISLELAAEYLVMAAILAEIKSRMLLPRPENMEGTEEDPRSHAAPWT